MFGDSTALTLNGYTAAAKTGATDNFTEAWTVGDTPSLATAVWTGEYPAKPGKGVSLARAQACPLPERARQPDRREEEQALAERAKYDPTAFEELYGRYFPKIYRFVYARVREQTAAEDVTSDVFIKALKNIHRYQDTGSSFSAWLYRIALYSVVDRYRAARPAEDLDQLQEQAADGPGPEDIAADRDELRRVWSVVEALPTNQRIAMVLRFQEDLAVDEIAAAMKKSPAAVKQLLFRGLRTVRQLVSRV